MNGFKEITLVSNAVVKWRLQTFTLHETSFLGKQVRAAANSSRSSSPDNSSNSTTGAVMERDLPHQLACTCDMVLNVKS